MKRLLFGILFLLILLMVMGRADAQVSGLALMPYPKIQFFDLNGVPLVGGKVYTYAAGTSTPLATYVDGLGAAQNTNPVILDSGGRAVIFLQPVPYKIVLKNAAGVTQWTVDNVSAFSPTGVTLVSSIINTPIITGGSLTSVVINNSTITNSTITSSTITNPTITGGSLNNVTINGASNISTSGVITCTDNPVSTDCLVVGAQGTSGNVGSQGIRFHVFRAGVQYQSYMQSQTNGDLNLYLESTANLVLQTGNGITTPNIRVSTSVGKDTGAIKHDRKNLGACGANTQCSNLWAWTTPFADNNYSVTCSYEIISGSNSQPDHVAITSRGAAGFQIQWLNDSVSASTTNWFDCIAIHD